MCQNTLISSNYHVIQKLSDQQGKLKELKAEHRDSNTTNLPGVQQQASFSTSYYLHFFSVTDPRLPFLQRKSREEPGRKDGKKPHRKDEADYRGETFRKD